MMQSSEKKMAGIILAAGTASRMGKTKQLLPFGESSILGRVVTHALSSDLDKLSIVLGHEAQKIQQHLKKEIGLSHADIIMNEDYKNGQSTSLIKGVNQLPDDVDAAMFLLGDQPLVTPEIINHLIDAFKRGSAPIAIPFCNGKRGNPVIISRALFPELLSITSDTGARVLFQKHDKTILKVKINNAAILTDVDTNEDYEKLISKKGHSY